MSIQQRVEQDWKAALKERSPTKDALSLIRTELKNKAIAERSAGQTGTEVDDNTALAVLSRMSKQRKESLEEYQKAARQDLIEKEALELSVIEAYMPQQLSEAEITAAIRATIAELGAEGAKDFGKVMKPVMAKLKGQADGKLVQAKIREILG